MAAIITAFVLHAGLCKLHLHMQLRPDALVRQNRQLQTLCVVQA